jgi:hypothetical protein
MNKMFSRVVLCVLALSLVSLAADRTLVTTHPVKGGHVARVEPLDPSTITLFSNFDDVSTGIYYCCSGNIIAGPNNIDGSPPYNEAIQFTLASASHIKSLATAVNYIVPGTSTTFQFNIEADASGVPSGTPINAHPYTLTIDSQSFGGCCQKEVKFLAGAGLSLAAGTYWVVWGTDSSSDLFAEVNVAIHDQVHAVNVAFSASSGATGTWNPYTSTLPFAVKVKGTTP